MNEEAFDKMVSGAIPAASIGDDRVERLIANVLSEVSRPAPVRTPWLRLIPVMQYALPMLVAAVLGVVVSSDYDAETPLTQFSTMMISSSVLSPGS